MESDRAFGDDTRDETAGKSQCGEVVDEELDDLLDDALNDFEKISSQQKQVSAGKESESKSDQPKIDTTEFLADENLNDATFNQMYDSILKMFSGEAKSKKKEDDASSSAQGGEGLPPFNDNVAEKIQKAMNSLNDNLGNIMGDGDMNLDMMDMLSKMNLDDGDDEIAPLVHDMMSNLLSKDILYPPLKELSLKYPQWLLEKEGKLKEEELQRYKEQFRLIKLIVDEFEAEVSGEPEKLKNERFERILGHMQRLGSPPEEIVGDLPKDFEQNFLPNMTDPSMEPNQCCIS